jgi:aspartate carbamoyltransferase
MVRLGGQVIQINNVQYSSVAKGETLEDTIRTMECYCELIVLRHPEEGAAHRAAAVASVPIINAGDGANEHPTQALLDFYTIRKSFPINQGLHVVMMGDLAHGRTVKSLAKLLRKFNVRISWVSPKPLQIEASYVGDGEIVTSDLNAVIESADVLYLTRTQSERMTAEQLPTADMAYGITPAALEHAPAHMLLLHPLPRTRELPTEIDADPRAGYFKQVQHGLYMRMAIIASVLS